MGFWDRLVNEACGRSILRSNEVDSGSQFSKTGTKLSKTGSQFSKTGTKLSKTVLKVTKTQSYGRVNLKYTKYCI